MKHKILLAAAISLVVLITPHYASAQGINAKFYGNGDVIRLTSNTPTELLDMSLHNCQQNFCNIEATGYVKVEDDQAVLKVWLEIEGGWNGSDFATDEEVTCRYIGSKSGALQTSFHTSMVKVFDDCKEYNIRLLGTNVSGTGSLYVNHHGIAVSCFSGGNVNVLYPNSIPPQPPQPPSEIVISGHVYDYNGRTPLSDVQISGFPSGVVAKTDINGFYSGEVPSGWSGALKPCSPSSGPCFAPATRVYTNVTSTLTDQNYKQDFSLIPCPACP